jgi:hypothetical protein
MPLPRRRRKKNPASPSYTSSHWGRSPTDIRHRQEVPDPRDNSKLIGLGPVHSIVYVTMKGQDQEPVEYEHKFSSRDPPLLAYGDADNKLYLVGGGYKVTAHGIVK